MSDERYRVKDVARMAGVTVRTLHHYDAIGLLVPTARSDAGYRLYDADDLLRLQQILINRELGLSLEQIRRLLDDPAFDRREALIAQREQLRRRANHVHAMLRSVDNALATLNGEHDMDHETLFDGFDPSRHDAEVKARWGHTDAYKESARRTSGYDKSQWQRIQHESNAIMARMAAQMQAGVSPEHDGPMEVAESHRLHIDRWFYPCSHAMHAGLSEMYTADSRFAASFDQHADGLAAFFAAAIRANGARES